MAPKKKDRGPGALLERIDADLSLNAGRLSEFRRYIHQHPELSGQEFETSAYLSRQLAAAGVPHSLGAEGRGIITEIIPGAEPDAPVIAIRADIDALPINEESETPYRSTR